jgi:tRNA 5-methylaminomethyl-2-thiouridine biosynthesis bifunctional protein
VEKHPLLREDLSAIHAARPELATPAAELLAAWPPLVPGCHRLEFETGRVVLTLGLGDISELLPNLRARADAIYLDGFAPAKNPEMWSPAIFRALARLAASGATAATWTVAGQVRDGLAAAGFAVEKRPGFGIKREMLVARLSGPSRDTLRQAPRNAVVLGAGIAGSAVASRLHARGWRVQVVERRPPPDGGAPDPIAGVFKPMLSLDDNIASRLSRAGCLQGLRRWSALAQRGIPLSWAAGGVLQLARDDVHEAQLRAIAERHRYPEDFLSLVTRQEAARLAGWPVAQGGLLIRSGGWINPITLCAAHLMDCSRVRVHWGRAIESLEHRGGAWRVRDGQGAVIAEAPVLVLANGYQALSFPQSSALPFRSVRGQVTFLPASSLRGLAMVVCREGCVKPAAQGVGSVGATFDRDDDPNPRAESHESNLARLERLLPGASAGLDPAVLDGRVGFRTATPDRLPLAGPLPKYDGAGNLARARLADVPRHSGLYGLLGLGARGLVWAEIGAELIASELEDEPLPMESDLAEAVDPGRFMLRAARRGRLRWAPESA